MYTFDSYLHHVSLSPEDSNIFPRRIGRVEDPCQYHTHVTQNSLQLDYQ